MPLESDYGNTGGTATTASTDLQQTIHEIVCTILERDVDPTLDVFEQGATSLAFIRSVAKVSERYGIAVDVSELEEASVEKLSELVAQQLETSAPAKVGV